MEAADAAGAPRGGRPARVTTLTLRPAAVVAGFGFLFLIGALEAAYGPALPGLQAQFGLGAAQVGLLFGAHSVGAIAGTLLAGAPAGRPAGPPAPGGAGGGGRGGGPPAGAGPRAALARGRA